MKECVNRAKALSKNNLSWVLSTAFSCPSSPSVMVRIPRLNFLLFLLLPLLFTARDEMKAQGLNFFRLQEANDIFSAENDDRYFTQGLKFEIMGTAFGKIYKAIGIRALFVKINSDSAHRDHYSLGFTQDFYTPADANADTVIVGDRPFAGTMYTTFRNVSVSQAKMQRIISELSIGVLGQAALGKQMQRGVHSLIDNQSEIKGWDYQLHNDLYLNYMLHIEDAIFSSKFLEANSIYEFNIGTVYDDFGIGGRLRFGHFKNFFDPYLGLHTRQGAYSTMGKMLKGTSQIYFFFNPIMRLVLYNALLQGGIFNNILGTEEYRMQEEHLSRFVVDGNYGIGIIIGRVRLELTEYFKSREFDGGYNHRYGTLNVTYSW